MRMIVTAVSSLALLLAALPAPAADSPPFYPSLLNTGTGKPVHSSSFENPERCRGCHSEIYDQWKGSMHANAFPDPVFQALWAMGEVETKGFTRNLCAGCHTPIGTVAEEVTFHAAGATTRPNFSVGEVAARGVQCDFCHTVTDATWKDTPTGDPENASLLVAPGKVKRGPYADARSPAHQTAFSALHDSAEFCGSCHHVFHPVTQFPIERTYDEWKQGPYAQAGIICQDCHMMPVEKAIETASAMKRPQNPGKAAGTGPEREKVFTHQFVGANFTVPAMLGENGHAQVAVARLKSAAALEVQAPAAVNAGELARFKVKVMNVGAGHNLPTSLTEIRQMWLDVTAADGAGNVVYRSGALDGKGAVDPDAQMFHAVAVDKEGRHTFKPWEIARFEEFRTIPPKGSDTSAYAFLVPAGTRGKLTITAVLRYRSFPQELADLLLAERAPTLPVTDMAAAHAVIPVID
jgi:hypothetical protein